jgi:aspartate racemase
MKPKTIGIIGGAGPLAGSLLLERVFTLSGSEYGCYKNTDFPEVILISYPFSEMLTPERDVNQLRSELGECISRLRRNGAAVLAIACNTLHAFLDDKEDFTDLVLLPQEVALEIPVYETPLVLCTSTSVQFEVHKQFFPCVYPDSKTQLQIDGIIERILKGDMKVVEELSMIISSQNVKTIVLGCTELSLLTKGLSCDQKIIDPLEIIAKKLLQQSFLK